MLNQSFVLKVFFQYLNHAEINIFMAGDKQYPENYRLVTVLSSFSKIFETVLISKRYNFRRTDLFCLVNNLVLEGA